MAIFSHTFRRQFCFYFRAIFRFGCKPLMCKVSILNYGSIVFPMESFADCE